jgi:hypothetical protein
MIGANGIYADVEKTKCELCGRDAGGYKLCEECREYGVAMNNCYLVEVPPMLAPEETEFE